ncbi:kinase-like protein [Xylariaceae sp. FL1651]|nr:kinase-like protein [Xylariaceae sp. FL1651]
MSTLDQDTRITLQQADDSPPSRCCDGFPSCRCHTEASRDRILRELLNVSEADLFCKQRRFVPRGSILHILDSQRVAKHLETFLNDTQLSCQLAAYVSPGHDKTCHCQEPPCTGSRIIFAALLRIGKESLIIDLYNQPGPKPCDMSFPFTGHSPFPGLLTSLTEKERQLFQDAQRQFRAHYLKRLEPDDRAFRELDDEAALPLLAIKERPAPIDGELSIVQCITIHPDHHNLGDGQEYFALKTFKRCYFGLDEKDFQKEFEANQQTPRHARIVPLLAAFKHGHEFHLLFPYASGGNLEELWKKYSSREALGDNPASWYSPQWLLNECLGLAASLVATHQSSDNTTVGGQHNHAAQLHADIKARNILCFEIDGKESIILKLADFGFAQRAGADLTLAVGDVVQIKTYRPPEHDLKDRVRLNYDVWCLGCVCLEFITWAVLGWSEVETFGRNRMDERDDRLTSTAKGEEYEDKFFRKSARAPRWYNLSGWRFKIGSNTEITSKKSTASQHFFQVNRGNIQINCKVKESVIEHIRKVRDHDQCVPEFQEFLDFIETRMLVVDAEARAESTEVESFLRRLAERYH